MSNKLNTVAGHAYAPGFEPGFLDKLGAFLKDFDIGLSEISVALVVAVAIFVISSRSLKSPSRRKKSALWAPGSMGPDLGRGARVRLDTGNPDEKVSIPTQRRRSLLQWILGIRPKDEAA